MTSKAAKRRRRLAKGGRRPTPGVAREPNGKPSRRKVDRALRRELTAAETKAVALDARARHTGLPPELADKVISGVNAGTVHGVMRLRGIAAEQARRSAVARIDAHFQRLVKAARGDRDLLERAAAARRDALAQAAKVERAALRAEVAGGLTEAEWEAGEWYIGTRLAYLRAIDAPGRSITEKPEDVPPLALDDPVKLQEQLDAQREYQAAMRDLFERRVRDCLQEASTRSGLPVIAAFDVLLVRNAHLPHLEPALRVGLDAIHRRFLAARWERRRVAELAD